MAGCGCKCHSETATVRDTLMDEHRVIERVLDAFERMLSAGAIDRAFTLKALDFFRQFADGCHHHKEEEQLFPAMELAGTPREGGPIGCMLHEHDLGRALLRIIDTNLNDAVGGRAAAIGAVREAGANYIGMLRLHIQKEDNILFVMAEQMLSERTKRELLAAFDRTEHAPGNEGKHGRYLQLANELSSWSFTAEPAVTP